MCGDCEAASGLSRRRFLKIGVAGGAAGVLIVPRDGAMPGMADAAAQAPSAESEIASRSAWGTDLPPTGPIQAEDDVRFLLVHHTAGSNSYSTDEVPGIIRGIFGFHTSPEKGWPDVAYNFFVDRHGGVWEARAGSLDGPLQGDATGGSQGFAQLCCSLGDHSIEPLTPEATAAMALLLATLAVRYGVDTAPGAETSFISRGSNLHPVGSEVTTATIAGHRDMSATACPGDFAYSLVLNELPAAVTAVVAAGTAPPATDPPVSSTTVASTSATMASTTTETAQPASEEVMSASDPDAASGSGSSIPVWAAAGAAGLALAGAATGVIRLRRRAGGEMGDAVGSAGGDR